MLFTIGYEKATLDHFIGTLQKAGVSILIDVRDRAQSRRKGFSKTALSEALNSHGIRYLHLKVLGDPKPGREAARAGEWAKFRKIYGEVVRQPDAIDALDQIVALAETSSVCLMCYERVHKECHRAIVVEQIADRLSCEAKHIGVQPIDPEGPLRNYSEGAAA
jgi:uncharacterized protein (DUF488 family)